MLRRSTIPSIIAICCTLIVCGAARAAATLEIVPALAPNAGSSPASFATWDANVINALQNNLATSGTPGTPGYFERLTGGVAEGVAGAIVSGFPSWRGVVNPGTNIGPAFAAEYGNRIHFNLHVVGDTVTTFKIQDLSFAMASSDGILDFNFGSPYTYSPSRVGLYYGIDRIKGNGDDIIYNAGGNTQLIDELFMRGSGNGYVAAIIGSETEQEAMDATIASLDPVIFVTGTFALGSQVASMSVTLPEPASLALLPLAGMLAIRRRKAS